MRLRLRAAANLTTRVVFSNSAMAPRTWRTRTAVGVSSMKCVGADAATRGDSLRPEQVVARELHHEVASKAVRALHDDRPRAIAHQALQHLREAGTGADGVCAADCRVVKRLDDLVAGRFGVSLDGHALADCRQIADEPGDG
jgi:hypothetical protein